jgi:biopolymer transport protein ExbD
LANWDVFHSDRLEKERGLTTAQVRAALARGDLRPDDLIRPAGATTPWGRLGDMPALAEGPPERKAKPAPQPEPPPKPAPQPKPAPEPEREYPTYPGAPAPEFFLGEDNAAPEPAESYDAILLPDDEPESGEGVDAILLTDEDDDDDDDDKVLHVTLPGPSGRPADVLGELDLDLDDRPGKLHLGLEAKEPSSVEVVAWDDDLDDYDPQEEDEAAAEFTLSRGGPGHVEELDLAAMVDVAFQLVLFFLVTATTILYKSLEVPKPNPETNAPTAAAQGRPKTLEDLKEVFIVVEIDPNGAVKIDSEPVRADLAVMIAKLRTARDSTERRAMLLSADFSTPHKSAVLAYDAANEIGLSIAIARPSQNANAGQDAPPAAKGAEGG